MEEKENTFSIEQRSYCKIRGLLGYTPTDIKADLDKVYGDQAFSYHTVLRWTKRFKAGRESLEDDPRSGRPMMAYNEKDIIAVRNAIDEDARYTVEEISDLTNINSSAVFSILKECLKLRKVCARWVQHLLTENQKRNRIKSASDLLDLYGDCDQRRLNEIVTGDEN